MSPRQPPTQRPSERLRQRPSQSIPDLWLLSDERNDTSLDAALAQLPRGSGFVFRHYHLGAAERRARFDSLSECARARGHTVILSGSGMQARQWGADGIYGPPDRMSRTDGLLGLATAHNQPEIVAAQRAGADAILLSPVFATRSHPSGQANGQPLGPVRFRLLASKAAIPVIALGGMTYANAKRLGWPRWAAIDGLAPANMA